MAQALTHERIVRAAIELIEADGLDAVSMRRLAAALDAGVMSLYNHVPSKSELFDAIVEFILLEDGPKPDPEADWREQARTLLRDFRDRCRRHPRCVPLVVARYPQTEAGQRQRETAHRLTRMAGLDEADAQIVVQTFVNFALGCLVHEAALEAGGALETPESDPEAEFEFGLNLLIGAVAAYVRV